MGLRTRWRFGRAAPARGDAREGVVTIASHAVRQGRPAAHGSGRVRYTVRASDVGWETAELPDDIMTGKTIQDLVGRVMLDREFLSRLTRDPDGVLAGYELTADERDVILQALGRGVHASDEERALDLQEVMLKRWAT
jgi:hypothetical protein